MSKGRDARGLALLQVLVMAVLLSLSVALILRLSLGQGIMANKAYEKGRGQALAQAALEQAQAQWDAAGPQSHDACVPEIINGSQIATRVEVAVSGAGPPYTVVITVPEAPGGCALP